MKMRYIDLGLTDYKDAYKFQIELITRVFEGTSENTLIITEHKSIITIGRKGTQDNIFKPRENLTSHGIDILNVDRGGDVTYHGPGQLVAYPIFKLEHEARDIHNFLSFLEEVGIDFLGKYGVSGERKPAFTGIWVKEAKIGSIGIGVKKWITYHGLAINVNTDLFPFSFIRPCGIEGVQITSLENLLHRKVDIDDAKSRLRESFEEISLLVEAVSQN